jgi:small subunit ribosomal protein S6
LETALKRLYEGMFLVDSALAAQDWQVIIDEVQRVMDRAEAEVISLKKWDERRLCYEVQKKSRGTYILAYFNCETSKIGGIERDVQLSELLTRVLVLRTDRMTPEDLEKLTPLEAVAADEAERAAAAEERAKVAAEAAEAAAAEAAVTEEATADTEPEADVATDAVADAEVSEAPEETEPAPAPEKTDDTAEEKAE